MKDWLNQRSTWLGFATAGISVISLLVGEGHLDPVWSTATPIVVSVFGLGVSDKQKGAK